MDAESSPSKRVPLIHITDLYHPPQDPDDQFDLATIMALPELNLKAVLLDVTERFLVAAPAGWDVARDPGAVIATRAGDLAGESFPIATGPRQPLASDRDDLSDQPETEQAAIRLLHEVLTASDERVAISVVGSTRILAAACLQAPDLMRTKVSGVWLNAGSTVAGELEWNVTLDSSAYRVLWQSGLPINWFPCATENGAFDPEPERGTHWSATHRELLQGVDNRWQGWFAFGLSGSNHHDPALAINELKQRQRWTELLDERRSLWSTASLVMLAGRCLARTAAGWRFVTHDEAAHNEAEIWPWRLDRITATPRDDAHIEWRKASDAGLHHGLFGRQLGSGYGRAMAEALNELLKAGLT